MHRRDLLQLASLGGLSLLGVGSIGRAQAKSALYEGPFWITVDAGGGWDPTLFCDPKGGTSGNRDSVNQSYAPEEISSVGPFRVPPVSLTLNGTDENPVEVMSPHTFFERNGSRVLLLNGVDTSTNNHETGSRLIWSGQSSEGFPNVGALAAANVFAERASPMAFLSYGGYDATGGVVPLTRASSVDALWRVAYPFRADAKKEDSATYFTDATVARLKAAQKARLERLAGQDLLPFERRQILSMLTTRNGDDGLERIAELLPANLVSYADFEDLGRVVSGERYRLGSLESLMRQTQLSLAAFRAGVAVSASLSIGGFDTHSNHDNDHTPRLMQVLRGVQYIFDELDAQGLADRVYVLVGSDFARTPYYNAQNGKDHWSVTSMLMAGPGIRGGRVIGETTAGQKPVDLDPRTLAPSSTGTRLTPQLVHKALRKHAKIDDSPMARRFPLGGVSLPLFES